MNESPGRAAGGASLSVRRDGDDTLIGGDDSDTIDGQQGNDVILLGSGDDLCQWDPGDGSDIIEGQDLQPEVANDDVVLNGLGGNDLFVAGAGVAALIGLTTNQ